MWTIPEYLERISFYFRYFEIHSYVVLFLFCIDNVEPESESEQAEQIWSGWGRCGQNSAENS